MATGSKSPTRRDDYVPRHAPARATKKASKKKSFLRRRWWLLLLLSPLVVILLGVGALYVAYARIKLPNTLPPIRTTYLYDRNGGQISTLHGAVDRTVIPLSKMSPNIIHAVIATEDHGFYNHPGVDVTGILRAAYTDLVKREPAQGASTITEQLVKNVYAGSYQIDPDSGLRVYVQPERSITEKIREALLAVKLEKELGKDTILEKYLNTVYFGHGAYGIQAAAVTYFGKPASRLTPLESASLAGVLHAPELYDPIDRPYDNRFRRDYALDQMVRYGYLDQATETKLKAKPCCGTVKSHAAERIVAPGQSEYFVDYTRRTLIDRYGEAKVFGGGLRVTTTLDLGLQRAAEAAIRQELPDQHHDPAAALVAMDPTNGQILAMAGGRDWAHNKLNFATMAGGSGREAGSAFKAFTLAAAMQSGYDLNAYWYGPSTLAVPGCTDPTQPDGLWHPVNAGDGEAGTFTLAGATAHSVNTIFAQVVAQLGPSKVVDMAHALGIRSDLPPVCSITLGSVAVNPLEMTNAYATLADHGERFWATPLLQVKSGAGKIDPSVTPQGDQVIAANDANLVTSALQGVVTGGTGVDAAIPPYPVAGKTGTANENVDAWFCGYTSEIVTCVWMGWPAGEIPLQDVEGVSSVYGGTIPAAIWHDFMSVAMQGKPPVAFPVPSFTGYSVGPSHTVYPSPSPTVSPCQAPSGSGANAQACGSPSMSPSATPTLSPGPRPSPSPSPTSSPSTKPSPTATPKGPGSPGP
ncbi:MAG TPA: transglycosylase domain-containing protein [Actinomycetota bacterium]